MQRQKAFQLNDTIETYKRLQNNIFRSHAPHQSQHTAMTSGSLTDRGGRDQPFRRSQVFKLGKDLCLQSSQYDTISHKVPSHRIMKSARNRRIDVDRYAPTTLHLKVQSDTGSPTKASSSFGDRSILPRVHFGGEKMSQGLVKDGK